MSEAEREKTSEAFDAWGWPEAERLLESWLGAKPKLTGLRPLSGGYVCKVLEATCEEADAPVILKLSAKAGDPDLAREARILDYLNRNDLLRVPAPYHLDLSGERAPGSCLIMERLPGRHYGDARESMTPERIARLEREIGEAVARLHSHVGEFFGGLEDDRRYETWTDFFGLRMREELEANRRIGMIRRESLDRVEALIAMLPEILASSESPRLVHGDLWTANLMTRSDGETPLSGFLDPEGIYANREYELAYLDLWRTVDSAFYQAYHAIHPPRDGYPLRRSVYGLHTLLLHVRFFKERYYAERSEQAIHELASELGLY